MKAALTILKSYLLSFSHNIRTPLSVIQNELTHLSSKLPAGECERALRACKKIGDLIKAESPESYLFNPEITTLTQLLDSVWPAVIIENNKDFSNLKVAVDIPQLCRAMEIVMNTIGEYKQEKLAYAKLTKADGGIGLTFKIYFDLNKPDLLNGGHSYDSLSEFFCLKIGLDSTLLPLADSIFASHSWRVQVEPLASNEFALTFKIPTT